MARPTSARRRFPPRRSSAPGPSPTRPPAARRRRAPRRFVVADRSMEPTLTDGQGLVAVPAASARAGQLRCFEHPERPGFWLVKRVGAVHADGTMTVTSDNTAAPAADSRSFGPVPVAGSYRVVVRVPLRWMGTGARRRG